MAERLIALGHRPLPSLAADLERASLKEDTAYPDALKMVHAILADLELIQKNTMAVQDAASDVDDRVTANLLDGVLDTLAGKAWMLRAFAS